MTKEEIRLKIAKDLKGKPSRNPDSLIPELAKSLGLPQQDVNNQVMQMKDIGHIGPTGQASIRLTDYGEHFYFDSWKDKVSLFYKNNWPHITSNSIALLALGVAIWSLLRH